MNIKLEDNVLAETINIQSTETTKSIIQINKIVAKLLILLVAVPLLFLCSVYTPTNAAPNDAGTTMNIISPLNNTTVQMIEFARGTAINVPEGQTLWILVFDGFNYFPQNIAQIQNNNEWRTQIRLGNREHTSREFEIYAVLANQTANYTIGKYCQNNTSKPMGKKLPAGAKIYDYVIVKRDSGLWERMVVILTKDTVIAAIIGAIGAIIGAIITAYSYKVSKKE